MAAHGQSPTTSLTEASRSRIIRSVFTALLLDILAFTTILPLFPRLLHAYRAKDNSTALHWFIASVHSFKSYFTGQSQVVGEADTVLVGGLLGSLFSFLQGLSAPWIGRLSDRYGRRPVFLVCMLGNIVSSVIWLFSHRFEYFLLARIIGGLSEGNVQLSHAIISDVTSSAQRSRGMAMVGIAFAIGFTVGPPTGAYFAGIQRDLSEWLGLGLSEAQVFAPYPWAALFTLALLLIETVYIYRSIPETILTRPPPDTAESATASTNTPLPTHMSLEQAQTNIRTLKYIHFLYLFVFAGMEFTLPFLTFDKFHFSHMEQGQFLGLIGIVSTILQGGVVRRLAHRWGEKFFVTLGMTSCALGFFSLATWAHPREGGTWGLYFAAICLAVTSATVVNCMTSLVSLCCTAVDPTGQPLDLTDRKGQILGDFRSMGQLGRALGPIVACSLYWLKGSAWAYTAGSLYISTIAGFFYLSVRPPRSAKAKTH
ncbi:hypothetical protein H4R33_002728 [Dimargaris cristalligena]|uniref:Major facilitator superfamily domain-containing protein n=1 Tax=Dimargaris cristalligena TaxID=215637 RepID=A0A4V1J4S0_9FUNG|nr:hypothetical protein H4R33_002728 [Dimargaris cristalligena]RKP36529.1 major facilitator superfamily domain-containing protein [Dimargaris cristalligena]|eukprot:RKP36529.1 major facilitator superfamily domain-containing protein [Dimargaris cristalligena]